MLRHLEDESPEPSEEEDKDGRSSGIVVHKTHDGAVEDWLRGEVTVSVEGVWGLSIYHLSARVTKDLQTSDKTWTPSCIAQGSS
jgi:hypothetical protein